MFFPLSIGQTASTLGEMRPRHLLLLLLVLCGTVVPAAVLAYNPYAQAAFGATSVLTSPTEIGAGLNQRSGIEACNLGPQTIHCGFTSAANCGASGLTSLTGRPVASGTCWSGTVSFNGARARLCCVAPEAQSSPADTRWNESF